MAKWVCWCLTVDPWPDVPDVPGLGMVIKEIFIGIHRSMMFGYVWILMMDGWLDGWMDDNSPFTKLFLDITTIIYVYIYMYLYIYI